MVINIGLKLGLESYRRGRLWPGVDLFVWVCFMPLVILKYLFDSLSHIFLGYEKIRPNVLCLLKEMRGWKKGRMDGRKEEKKEGS